MIITAQYHRIGVALLRILVGIIFLWAGLEKVLGEGLWNGVLGEGSEGWTAAGFLQFGTTGTLGWPFVTGEVAEGTVFNPTHEFWASLTESQVAMAIVNYTVPLGQLAIGVALILGLFTRFAAFMGALQMLLFFVAAWEFQYGIVNQHLTYAVVCLTIAGLGAGKYYGLDGQLMGSFGEGVRRWLMSGDPALPQTPANQEPGVVRV